MDLSKQDTDRMPEEAIENRARTYQTAMNFGYVWALPLTLGVVMFFVLLLMKTGIVVSAFLGFLTVLGVMAFAKAFFVH